MVSYLLNVDECCSSGFKKEFNTSHTVFVQSYSFSVDL